MVAAGKHDYLEKPVTVDVPGALKVIEIGKRAENKLSLDVGIQIRDCPKFFEMVNPIHNGALGNIICGEAHYLGEKYRAARSERYWSGDRCVTIAALLLYRALSSYPTGQSGSREL